MTPPMPQILMMLHACHQLDLPADTLQAVAQPPCCFLRFRLSPLGLCFISLLLQVGGWTWWAHYREAVLAMIADDEEGELVCLWDGCSMNRCDEHAADRKTTPMHVTHALLLLLLRLASAGLLSNATLTDAERDMAKKELAGACHRNTHAPTVHRRSINQPSAIGVCRRDRRILVQLHLRSFIPSSIRPSIQSNIMRTCMSAATRAHFESLLNEETYEAGRQRGERRLSYRALQVCACV